MNSIHSNFSGVTLMSRDDDAHDNINAFLLREPLHYERDAFTIRILFHITGLCAGLPALIWAVRSLHLVGGDRVSSFSVFLLFSDALELILLSLTVTAQLGIVNPAERTLLGLYPECIATRFCGFSLHQLVALEGIISLRYPLSTSAFFSPLVSIPISLTLWTCAFFPYGGSFISITIMTIIFAIVCLMNCVVTLTTCLLSCTSSICTGRSCSNVLALVVVAVFTFVILHVLGLVAYLYGLGDIPSLRLIADPLLCVLASRIAQRQPSLTETGQEPV